MIKNFLKISAISTSLLLILPSISLGQSYTSDFTSPISVSDELGIHLVPEYPGPNQNVSISLTLYSDDLNSANITWYKDGKNVLSGKGETRLTFTTGNAGVKTSIEVAVTLAGGSTFSKTLSITPASVDLIWEAYSYVPPLYKGKALHPKQGGLKIVAMPNFIKNGSRVSEKNLVYKWYNGSNVYDAESGYGRNVLAINGSILGKSESIKVLVTDPNSGLVAEGFLDITPTSPQIIFYENDPYYGYIFDRAIKNTYDLEKDEVQIFAAPFNFTKEQSGRVSYEWKLNRESVQSISGLKTAIFRKPEGASGQSNLSLNVENSYRILQQASQNLVIKFSE